MSTLIGIGIGVYNKVLFGPSIPRAGTALTLEDGLTALTLEDGLTALVLEDA